MLTRMQSWSRRHGIDGFRVAYFCTLLGCGVLLGLFVGGYKGYMDAATPAVDAPGSFTQLATSDVGWTAMVKQDWAASHRYSDSAVENARGSFWQHFTRSAATDRGVGCHERDSASGTPDMHVVRRATSAGNGMQKMVVTP